MDARAHRTATREINAPEIRPLGDSGSDDVHLAQLRNLRIALVHDWLTGMRGGEKCLDVLCRTFPGATLHTLIHRRGSVSPAIESMRIQTSPLQHVPGIFRHYRHWLPIMPWAASRWKAGDVDLVVSLSHCVAKSIAVPAGVPHVCYCFTPMRYAWQGRDAYLESWSDRPFRREVARRLLDRLRNWDLQSSRRVTDFVAISETIQRRIADCYDRDSHIIEPPVDTDFYTPGNEAAAREDFYLVVSALVPYKRVDQAILACRRQNRRLVVIGEGPERSRLESIADGSATFLGWQSDEAIRDHYRRCRALLFPGEEDFGIVPVEALGCGSAVIALRRGGVAETVTDETGRLYAEPTVDSLAAAIGDWEEEGRPHDPRRARERAESYSLARFRQRLLTHLATVVERRSHQGSLVAASVDPVPPAPHVGRANPGARAIQDRPGSGMSRTY
jgi:glycosyltransferase involved in cell wall biosynthesis